MRTRGKLIWFNEAKDVGALATDEGERLEFTGDAFVGERPVGRCGGTPVELRVVDRPLGRTAAEIVVVPFIEPRRARVRSRGAR